MMLAALLTSIDLNLEQLLLDPNNPRFSELGDELIVIPEQRYAEERIQINAYEKMKSDSFDVAELKDTIKQNSFLPMDRIVVRRWVHSVEGNTRYVVVEGNRRITALKWLKSLHADGRESFSEEQLLNFSSIPALLLDQNSEASGANLILPGLRHVSGVKEWGPYQKAKAVHALRNMGKDPKEAAQSLGLSTRSANKFYRCFLALERMKSDEEYGESAHPKLFSYFEETFKSPKLTTWLAWSENSGSFENHSNLNEFYSWIVPNSESDESPKLAEAKSMRELATIINDDHAMSHFRADGGTLTRALARFEADHPDEWFPKVVEAISAIKTLSSIQLKQLTQTEIENLSDLMDIIGAQLKDREKLLSTS